MRLTTRPGMAAAAALALTTAGCQARDGGDAGGPSLTRGGSEAPPLGEPLLAGEHTPVLLFADLVTPDVEIEGGQVLFVQDRILCAGRDCDQGAFEDVTVDAPVISSDDRLVAFPGLIDIHNHISWNTWDRTRLSRDCYDNRDQWRGESAYDAFKSKQGAVSAQAFCEATLYGELRALVGGATLTQGATLGRKDWDDYKCLNTLVRNIDEGALNGGLGGDHASARISRVTRMDAEAADRLKAEFQSGATRAFLVHVGEGVDEYAREEFDALDRLGLVGPELVAIHGTGFGQAELNKMGAAGAHLVMSPISNAMYYGGVTDAVLARDAGVNLSIAPDWSPSGGESMLEELRYFDAHNRQALGGAFSDEEIVEMATLGPARALKLEQQLGRLRRNYRADMVVIRSDAASPRRALLEASAGQVALVTVGGRIRYGDTDLLRGVVGDECEEIEVCGIGKTLCVTDPGRSDELGRDWTYADIRGRLEAIHPDLAALASCDPAPPVPFCIR